MVYADLDKKRATERAGQQRRLSDPAYREAYNAQHREYWRANPYPSRGRNMKRLYGITRAEYRAMVVMQCGACAICGEVPSENPDASNKTNKLVVDHDHATGIVRDLLCSRCNLMLGRSRDSAQRLLDGAAYLREWKEAS